jgi:hypothetical protein
MTVLNPDANAFTLGRRVAARRAVERGGGVPRHGASADTRDAQQDSFRVVSFHTRYLFGAFPSL